MKLFNRNIFALLASVSLLTSCSDDVLLRDKDNDGSESGIVFYVPNVPEGANPETGTRAIGNVNDFNGNEAEIKNLRVFAYKDGSENPITINLKEKGNLVESDVDGYQGYRLTVDLENGEYEMYAIANSTISDNTTKSQLLAATATVPDDIAASGLPMSCSNARMEIRGTSGFTPVGSNKTISVESGKSLSIRANLKFAVSKVRVTVLNDLRPGDLMGEVKVNRHANSSSLLENGTVPTGTGSTVITGNYFALNPADIPADILDMNIEKNSLTAATPVAGGSTPWLWQTVFYVPERLTQTATDGTSITMKIGDTTKEQPLGNKDNNRALERSHFYDYIGTIDGKFLLDVQPWTPAILAGALEGTYWLKVDQTSVSINAGFNTELQYESNAEVIPDCNQYRNQDIYRFKKENGVITVTLNPEIDREEFTALKATDDWKYFTLTAGTIVKKIAVTDFNFSEFIMEDQVITIDVNERKESGQYDGTFNISLYTNLPAVKLEKTEWVTAADEGEKDKPTSSPSLEITNMNGNGLVIGAVMRASEAGEVKFKLAYNGLNSDRDLWKESNDLKLTVKGIDNNGNVIKDENGNEVTCTIYIYIRPSYDVYKIHFYAQDWSHPHIYVYQVLKMPGDLSDTQRRNRPVGYMNTNGQYYAALEYDFTGAVAFKGWYSSSYNQPNNIGDLTSNFWVFDDGTDWDPAGEDFNLHYNSVDFCKEHRKKLKESGLCTVCTQTNFPKSWPGVHMERDTKMGNGWWYFELSGVADPGRALIMFTECPANNHSYNENMEMQRYPYKINGEDMPGVALFDYPTKEGWFVFNKRKDNNDQQTTSYFVGEKPSTTGGEGQTTSTFEIGKKYALVFNGSAEIWAWAAGDAYSANKGQQWDSQPVYNGVFEFTPTKAGNTSMSYKVRKADPEYTLQVSSFKWNTATSRYEATINI